MEARGRVSRGDDAGAVRSFDMTEDVEQGHAPVPDRGFAAGRSGCLPPGSVAGRLDQSGPIGGDGEAAGTEAGKLGEAGAIFPGHTDEGVGPLHREQAARGRKAGGSGHAVEGCREVVDVAAVVRGGDRAVEGELVEGGGDARIVCVDAVLEAAGTLHGAEEMPGLGSAGAG